MKQQVLTIFIAAAAAIGAQAQNITWGTPQAISGVSDVSTDGTQFSSWAPYDGNIGNYAPFNGVPFVYSAFPGANDDMANGNSGFGVASTPDVNYNDALSAAQYGSEVANGSTIKNFISWNGMTVGNTYEVQFWVEDTRNLGITRSETFSGGAADGDATPVGSDTSSSVYFPGNGTGDGEYIIGTFVADTDSAIIGITPYSSTDGTAASQFNLAQIRDLGAVPEPSTWALAGMGALGMWRLRKRS